MRKRSRYRSPLAAPRFDYEIATIGEGVLRHAVMSERTLCGIGVRQRVVHYSEGAVSCQRCRQRLAAAPHLYARPSSTPPPAPVAEENLRVILMLLEELGGNTTLLAEPSPAALAEQVATLLPLLSSHAIVIGVLPRSDASTPRGE